MSVLDHLLSEGYTLPGAPVKTALNPGDTPEAGIRTDGLSNLTRQLQTYLAQQEIDQQKKQKKMQEDGSAYKTLRDAGYTPEKAHAAVRSGNFPSDVPGLSMDDKLDQAKLDQTASTTDLTKAQTAKTAAETSVVGNKKNTIESKIMNKLANGEDLTPGEQKIYDDVIKKKNNGGLAELLSQMDNGGGTDTTTPSTAVDQDVAVVAPDGTKGKIKASKLAAALAKGFKKAPQQ